MAFLKVGGWFVNQDDISRLQLTGTSLYVYLRSDPKDHITVTNTDEINAIGEALGIPLQSRSHEPRKSSRSKK
jgi:hypothetical protein